FRRLSDFAQEASDTPFVSVLVPARNEERAIGACLASLIGQDYPAYEVLVLDDGSDDRTARIVQECAARSGVVRAVTGEPLPPGWLGKAFACWQLQALARGEIVLFTDADTVHDARMIRSVAGAMAGGADVVTAFPQQLLGSWSE